MTWPQCSLGRPGRDGLPLKEGWRLVAVVIARRTISRRSEESCSSLASLNFPGDACAHARMRLGWCVVCPPGLRRRRPPSSAQLLHSPQPGAEAEASWCQ